MSLVSLSDNLLAGGFIDIGLAWLIFSGKKHDVHVEADELVAIVYDGTYDVLEGTEYAVSEI